MSSKFREFRDSLLRELEEIDKNNKTTLMNMEIEHLKKRILSVKEYLHQLEDSLARREHEQKEREKRQKPV